MSGAASSFEWSVSLGQVLTSAIGVFGAWFGLTFIQPRVGLHTSKRELIADLCKEAAECHATLLQECESRLRNGHMVTLEDRQAIHLLVSQFINSFELIDEAIVEAGLEKQLAEISRKLEKSGQALRTVITDPIAVQDVVVDELTRRTILGEAQKFRKHLLKLQVKAL